MAKGLQELRSLVARVKDYAEQDRKLNEAATKAALVEPLLEWIGWDTRDPDEVRREWKGRRSRDEPVDYALFANDALLLLVEAKRLDDPMRADKGWKQLVTNGVSAGFRWCARTNGRLVIMVNLLHQAPLEGKVFWTIDLAQLDEPGEMTIAQAAETLGLLSNGALLSGETETAWDESRAQLKIAAGIEAVLTRPPQPLIDMVREQAGDSELPSDQVAAQLAKLVGRQPLPPPDTPKQRKRKAKIRSVTIDGEACDDVKYAKDILVCTAEWLVEQGKLTRQDCPVVLTSKHGEAGPGRYSIHSRATHPSGKEFFAAHRLSNGLWVETHAAAKDLVQYATRLLEWAGYSGDLLSVEFAE